jgi:hypothetical protein
VAAQSLSFDIFANDRASETFRKLGLAADNASGDVRELGERLDKLGTRVSTARVALEGDKEANIDLDKLDVKLIRLGNKVADPNITVEGKVKALADIAVVDLALDKLDAKHATPEVSVHRGVLSRLGGLLGGGGAGGAAAGGAAGGGAARSFGNLTGAFAALPTPVQVGLIGTALAALPFLAQAAAGAITVGLGGALTGIGVIAAMKIRSVKESFKDLTTSANANLHNIGLSFAPAMESIFRHVSRLFGTLTPVIKSLAGPFKIFSDALLNAFMQPAVTKSLQLVATAFGDILKALAPQLAGDIQVVATGISQIAKAVAANPRAFADFISFFIRLAGWSLSAIAGLTLVANYIEEHFLPALHRVAVIFDGVRHDIAHVWDQIFENTVGTVIRLGHNIETQFNSIQHGIADAFDGIRHTFAAIGHDIAAAFDAVRRTFAGIGHSIANTFDAVRHFQGQFDAFGKDVAFVRHAVLAGFDDIRHGGAIAFDALRHAAATSWDRMWKDIMSSLAGARHNIAAAFDAVRHGIATAWDAIWHRSNDQAASGIAGIVAWFRKLPGRVISAMWGFGHSLYAFGHAALSDFLDGLRAIAGAIVDWAKHFFGGLVHAIGRFLGMSPPHPGSAFYDLGANMMHHLAAGIRSRAEHVRAAAQQVANVGSGVQRWARLVSQALAMEGLSPMLLGRVLYQMQTESGGNPNAINLTDSNAQHGDPSRGLMQVIMGTFRAYHWPGTSMNIYDPLANIAAALNYARHVYGPSLMSGGMGIGSGHGYAAGSWQVPFTGPAMIHKDEMIIPARTAAAIRGGGAVATVVLEVRGNDSATSQFLVQMLRKHVRTAGGGSVQVALGRG